MSKPNTSISDNPLLLIFPFNLLSHYLRTLVLARQLRPYFDIRFAHSEKYAAFIDAEGFLTFPCASLNAEEILQKVKRFNFSWMNTQELGPVLSAQMEAIQRYQPQVVMGDASFTLKIAAEATGTFYISLMNAYMSKYYAEVRRISSTHPFGGFLNFFPAALADFLTQKGETMKFRQLQQPFNSLRQKYGLPEKKQYIDELEGDLNLLCDLPELFPQKDLPLNYTWIPPLFYNLGSSLPSIAPKLSANKKTIFISMGSSGDWQKVKFLNNTFFNRYTLITAGDHQGTIKAAIKLDFATAEDVLPYTDLVLCHGGNGTIYQALHFGIPLLCFTDHLEQEWNVHALEKANLGRSLNGKSRREMANLVEYWIERKGSPINEAYADKMRKAANSWDQPLAEILRRTIL